MKKQRNFFLISKIIILLIVFSFSNLYAKDYYVDTSRGPQKVVIPEGVSEIDAFLTVSRLYLEERWDHEDLINDTDNLLKEIEEYKKSNDSLELLYKEAIEKGKEISDLYKEKSRTKLVSPELVLGSSYVFKEGTILMNLMIGAEFFEKFKVYTNIGFPFSVGLSIGVSF